MEDDEDVRAGLAGALEASGAEVIVAADGIDALERLRAGARPAVILLDLRLPRLAGAELLAAIRADPRLEHIPVITMTAGHGSTADRDVVANLRKPVDLDDLRQIVLSLFETAA